MSDYETTQKKRNIIVGIFVIAALSSLIWLIFKFGDLPVLVSKYKSFEVEVQFPTARGVQENTSVQFCGYRIGRVTKVKPPEVRRDLNTGQSYYQTVVTLSLDRKYGTIPADVEVKLMTRGLGSSYIELMDLPSDPNEFKAVYLSKDSLLQGSVGTTSEFFPAESQKKLDELVNGLGTLIKNANEIIGDKANKENFKVTLANASEATKQATQALKEFQEFAAAGSITLKDAEAGIDKIVNAFVGTSEELSKATAELQLFLEKVNEGEGSAGKLLNDGRLYEDLLENSHQLQMLLEELTSFITEVNEKGLRSKWK